MEPDFIVHKIPKVECYEVAEWELDQIDGSCRLPERYLGLFTISFTTCVSLVIAWASASAENQAKLLFGVLAIIVAAASVVFGFMWLKVRSNRADVIQRIRDRRVDPGLPDQE